MTSSWFFLFTLNYDARSTTHQKASCRALFLHTNNMSCPFNRLILMYVTISLSLYNVYNSSLYFILHSPLSFVVPKIALKIFLSKTPVTASSNFDNTHVSEPYASTGLVKLYTITKKKVCEKRLYTAIKIYKILLYKPYKNNARFVTYGL